MKYWVLLDAMENRAKALPIKPGVSLMQTAYKAMGCDQVQLVPVYPDRLPKGYEAITDENLMTSVEGIYAAGDVSGIEEASSAMVEGRLAGFAAAKALGLDEAMTQSGIEAARAELEELRSGPMGARIRAGLDKIQEKRGEPTC